MAIPLPQSVKNLLQDKAYGHVITFDAKGQPQVTMVWMDVDGDEVTFNTAEGRVKPKNLRRDPRVMVSVQDRNNPQAYALISGKATLTNDGAEDHIDRLAKQGVRLTQFYSNAPVCTPTRAALLTGRWQQRVGLEWAFGFTAEQWRRVDGRFVAENDKLAPGLDPTLAFRLVLVFAFAQAVHYTVWLRLIPNSGAYYTRSGPSTFRANVGALRRDLGRLGWALAVVACLAVPIAGVITPVVTRETYLSLVAFHGWLELASAATLLVRARA